MKESNTADAAGSSAAIGSTSAPAVKVTMTSAIVPAPNPAAPPSAIDEKIEVWFAKHFHNLGALLDERMHNVIQAAKEDLKAELAKL